MAKQSGHNKYQNKASVAHDAWVAYLSTIDSHERTILVNYLRRSDMSTKEGLAEFAAEVLMSIVEGKLPPGITDQLLGWAQFLHEVLSGADSKNAIETLNLAVVANASAAPKRELPNYDVLEDIEIPTKTKARTRVKEK